MQEIWAWYAVHKRTLPWRDLTDRDSTERAYKVLVSEIMLQQTQVPRVIITFKNFLERFPTIAHLAKASNRDVLIAWRGMGYNSRALRLRDGAKTIVAGCWLTGSIKQQATSQQATFPTSMNDLLSIPGIGPYTAAAIRNFAFGLPTPCIDTNIRRILHRTFFGPENPDGTWERGDEELLEIAGEVLVEAIRQKGKDGKEGREEKEDSSPPSDWHAALMDFGSLVQTKRNPTWEICPLTRAGVMKTAKRNFVLRSAQGDRKKEPGRHVGSVFIPNRIFRGRIVEALRDEHRGLTRDQIGQRISVDWDKAVHKAWLDGIMKKLLTDRLIREQRGKYVLG